MLLTLNSVWIYVKIETKYDNITRTTNNLALERYSDDHVYHSCNAVVEKKKKNEKRNILLVNTFATSTL